MILLWSGHFDAAHRLVGYDGPCARLHGHRWKVDLEIEGNVDPITRMVMDFKDIKAAFNRVAPDHQFINDFWPNVYPTAEMLAPRLFDLLKAEIPGLVRLTLWESENAGARYPV